MLKYNLSLLVGSAVICAGAIAVSAFQYDGAPDRAKDSTETRKNGDMLVIYRGGSYRSLSTRRGSIRNRTFTGGGLRGGK